MYGSEFNVTWLCSRVQGRLIRPPLATPVGPNPKGRPPERLCDGRFRPGLLGRTRRRRALEESRQRRRPAPGARDSPAAAAGQGSGLHGRPGRGPGPPLLAVSASQRAQAEIASGRAGDRSQRPGPCGPGGLGRARRPLRQGHGAVQGGQEHGLLFGRRPFQRRDAAMPTEAVRQGLVRGAQPMPAGCGGAAGR